MWPRRHFKMGFLGELLLVSLCVYAGPLGLARWLSAEISGQNPTGERGPTALAAVGTLIGAVLFPPVVLLPLAGFFHGRWQRGGEPVDLLVAVSAVVVHIVSLRFFGEFGAWNAAFDWVSTLYD